MTAEQRLTPDLPEAIPRRHWTHSALLAVIALLTLAVVVMIYTRIKNPHHFYGTAYPADTIAPPLQGTDEKGKPLALSDLKGKTVAVFFGFLSCPNICPTTLAGLEDVRTMLPKNQQDQFITLLVSVDPKRDTVSKMKGYVEYFSPKAKGLIVTESKLRPMIAKWGADYQYADFKSSLNYQVNHTTGIYLVDAEGKLRLVWDYTQLIRREKIAQDVREVLR